MHKRSFFDPSLCEVYRMAINMNIIEELFFENIRGGKDSYENDSQYLEAIETIDENEDLLPPLLKDEEKRMFLALTDAYSDVLCITSCEEFIRGFKIGAKFILDTFVIETDSILKDA